MAETLTNGTVIPSAGDPISAAGVQEMRTLGVSVDAALSSLAWYKGPLPDGTDPDTLNLPAEAGAYSLASTNTYPGLPFGVNGNTAILTVSTTGFAGYQQIDIYQLGWIFRRRLIDSGSQPPGWTEWQRVDVSRDELPTVRTVNAGESFDDFRTDGEYLVNTGSIAKKVAGWPADATPNTARCTVRMNTTGIGFQTIHIFGSNGGVWERRTGSISQSPFPWRSWTRLDAQSGGGGSTESVPSGTNRLLVEDFARRHGGYWHTGQKAAIAFRFDHGLTNFRDKVLPLTSAAGLRVSLALNARNWGYAENAGVTADDVNAWVQAGHVEIWNHGATHGNRTTEEGLYDEIVNGLSELRAQIPAAQIDGWVVPGVGAGSGSYMGFGSGTSIQSYYETYAGRLILDHHAIATGHIPGSDRLILDGTARQGMRHYGFDGRDPSVVTAEIDHAVANRTGLQLMLHPSVLDTAGMNTTANLEAIIDYVVQARSAGDLVTCSPYELALADSRF